MNEWCERNAYLGEDDEHVADLDVGLRLEQRREHLAEAELPLEAHRTKALVVEFIAPHLRDSLQRARIALQLLKTTGFRLLLYMRVSTSSLQV